MSINQIAKGVYNRILNKEQELFKYRYNICKDCKLFIDDVRFGPICNKYLYLNPKTDETSSEPKKGFSKGCGCILKAKCRVPDAKCPNNKW